MNVLIGIPSGRGNISAETASTVVVAGQVLAKLGMAYDLSIVSHADVSVARNILAAVFLNGNFDIFLGVDDDVGVSREIVEHFLRSGHDFIGTYLPQRGLDFQRFEQAIRQGLTGQAAQRFAAPLVGPAPPGDDLSKPGIRTVDWIGTGFYLLRKSVLNTIISKKLAVKEVSQQANYRGTFYGFFNNITSNEGYLSEDMSFCSRVRAAGYEIRAYAGPGISHTGTMRFCS